MSFLKAVISKLSNKAESLVLAARQGHLTQVRSLLEQGVDVNTTNKLGESALIASVYSGDIDTVQLLLDKGADVKVQDKDGWTPLIAAAANRQHILMKALLTKYQDVNLPAKDGKTALMMAVKESHIPCVELLLGRNADVDIQDNDGWTALMFAAQYSQAEIIRLLLNAGANPNLKNSWGETASTIATHRTAFSDILEPLREAETTFDASKEPTEKIHKDVAEGSDLKKIEHHFPLYSPKHPASTEIRQLEEHADKIVKLSLDGGGGLITEVNQGACT